MTTEVKVHVVVTQGDLVLAEMVTPVSGGRHEFTFSQAISANGRHFEGFALEMWLDQEARRIVYNEHLAKRAFPAR